MAFTNSTFPSVALLPSAMPISFAKQHDQLAPAIISWNPWTMFDKSWTMLTGQKADDFAFRPGITPMSTLKESVTAIAFYYLVIFGGRELMRNRPALKLNTLFIIHNFYLTIISGGLLLLFVQQLVPSLWKHGLFANVCGGPGWTKQLVLLYYLNYLTKYLELLDTVFLVLKKKPLIFLHTYHHGATALLCYSQLMGETSVSWVPITLNLTVHVVMYWYYYQAARGVRVWWKRYITMLQISQFVLDLGFIYFATYTHFAHEYAPMLPHKGSCGLRQQQTAAFAGCCIITSYLVLFILFYLSTYKKPSAKKVIQHVSKVKVPSVQESSEKASTALRLISSAVAEAVKDENCTRRK